MFIGYIGTPGERVRMHLETMVRSNAEDQLQPGEVLVASDNIGAARISTDGQTVTVETDTFI